MRAHPLLFLLVLLLAASVRAQPGRNPDPRLRTGGMQYAEAVCLPSDSAGLARVDVFVRVSFDFMIFTRGNGGDSDARFTAAAEISASLRRDGTTVRTGTVVAHAIAEDYQTTIARDRYVLLHQAYYVEPGSYEMLVEIADRGSTRQSVVRQQIRAQRFDAGSAHIGEPFCLTSEPEDGPYGVFAFGRAIPFAETANIGVPLPADLHAVWKVRLTPLDEDSDTLETVFDDYVQPIDRITATTVRGDAGVVKDFRLAQDPAAVGDIAVLPLPFEGFDVGRYQLTLVARWEGGADTVTVPVRILWRDMPFSMRDIRFAIESMRFILTKDEYDEMRSGSEREMQRAFRRYWRQQDATPETEHNEMMTEYFRRVDEAYFRFQTLFVQNGIQTDRGKVYVLFGPPEDLRRIMSVDEPPIEIWEYPSLGKSFRFIDKDRDGNLRLMEE